MLRKSSSRRAPDGYTLFQSDISALAINVTLAPNMPYDPIKDFTPITLTWNFPSVLVVPNDSPAKTGAELIALAKTKARRADATRRRAWDLAAICSARCSRTRSE